MSLLFANKSPSDILCKEDLESFKEKGLKLTYTVDKGEPGWTGEVGFITKEMIAKYMPAPGPDTLITHCGPKQLNQMVRTQLLEMGYSEEMIFKF